MRTAFSTVPCASTRISQIWSRWKNAIKGMSDNKYFETNRLASDDEFDRPVTSIHGLMDSLIAEGLAQIGMPPDKMNKEAKIKLLRFLDERGVFMIQKSGQTVCGFWISQNSHCTIIWKKPGEKKRNKTTTCLHRNQSVWIAVFLIGLNVFHDYVFSSNHRILRRRPAPALTART